MKALLVLGAVVIAIALLACGGDGDGGGELTVEVREWSVQPQRDEGSGGSYTIELSNEGTRQHQLLIVKSDLPIAMLPTGETGIDEALVNVVARLDTVQPGSTTTQTVELSAGKYVLLCNIIESPPGGPVQSHYGNGMAASFLIDQ